MERVGRNLTRSVSLPLALIGAGAVATATSFDASMTKIETLVGVATAEVDAMRESVLAMSGEVGRGPGELAEGLFFVTSAGLRGQKALDALFESARLSAIGLGETKVTADALTTALNAYAGENLSANRAANILLRTVRAGKIEADALAAALGRVLAPAAALGVSFEEVGAFVATFTRVLPNADEAVTALRATLSTFQKGTPDVRAALESLGTSLDQVRAKIAGDGLAATLVDLAGRMKGSQDAVAAVFPNLRALTGFLATAGIQGDTLSQVMAEMADASDSVGPAFDRTRETAKFAFDQLLANLERVGVRIGTILLPAVNEIAAELSTILDGVEKIDAATLKWGLAFAGVALVAGPVLSVIGHILTIGVRLAPVFKLIGGLLASATAWAVALGGFAVLVASFFTPWREGIEGIIRKIPLIGDALADAVSIGKEVADRIRVAFLRSIQFIGQKAIDLLASIGERLPDFLTAGFTLEGAQSAITGLGAVADGIENVADAERDWRRQQEENRNAAAAATEAARKHRVELENTKAAVDALNNTPPPQVTPPISPAQINALRGAQNMLDDQRRKLREIRLPTNGEGAFLNELELGEKRLRALLKTAKSTPEAVDQMVNAWRAGQKEIRAETERTSNQIRFQIGDKIASAYGSAIDGFLRGTRESLDVLEVMRDVGIALVSEMFTEMLKRKLKFDVVLEGNFLTDIPAMLGKSAEKGAAAFAGLFDNVGGENVEAGLEAEIAVETSTASGGFRDFFSDMADGFSNLFSKVSDTFKDWAGAIGRGFENLFGGLFSGFTQIASGILSILSSLIAAIGSALASIGGGLLTAVGSIFSFAQGGVARGPQIAKIGDNPGGLEAVIPSERFGEVFGAGGDGNGVVVNISTREPLKAERRRDGLREIIEITSAAAQQRVNESIATGGATHGIIAETFGINRRPGA